MLVEGAELRVRLEHGRIAGRKHGDAEVDAVVYWAAVLASRSTAWSYSTVRYDTAMSVC